MLYLLEKCSWHYKDDIHERIIHSYHENITSILELWVVDIARDMGIGA
jgi:hypothetical protein